MRRRTVCVSGLDADDLSAPLSGYAANDDGGKNESQVVDYQRLIVLYPVAIIYCNILAAICVLITFGMAYPPLGVVISVYVITTTFVVVLTMHLHEVEAVGCSAIATTLFEAASRQSALFTPAARTVAKWAVPFASVFFGLFLLDMTQSVILPLTLVCTIIVLAVLRGKTCFEKKILSAF